MGENHFAAAPSSLYGFVLLMCAVAYGLLQEAIIRSQGSGSILKQPIEADLKGKQSVLLYLVRMFGALWTHGIAQGLYPLLALLRLVPDRRIERTLSPKGS
jgi:uncharacterized membrane protein